ncbi:MAG: ATP-dependent DNA helicase RecG [Leptolinea sp.]|jgi:ATP-dependent DNA helicase RecG|nr:ATP-dependent DNA helicase RecG [Leptolinea sp.]
MPSIVESLSKFLNLEKERGFKNTAIIGGLHKVVPYWENEARSLSIPPETIKSVTELLDEYSAAEGGRRQDIIQELNIHLMGISIPLHQENRPQLIKRTTGPLPRPQHPTTSSPTSQTPPDAVKNNVQPSVSVNRPVQTVSPSPKPIQTPPAGGYRQNRPQTTGGISPRETPAPRRITPGSRLPDSLAPVTLSAPLTVISGIGEETARKLQNLNLYTLKDLLYNFPRDYHDFSQAKTINRIMYGDTLTVIGTIQSIHARDARSGKVSIVEAVIGDSTGNLRITWFNRRFLVNQYHPGDQVSVSGTIKQYLGRLMMDNPEIEPLEADNLSTNRISPVYPLTAGISQKFMRRIMKQTVDFNARRVQDYLPDSIRTEAELFTLPDALQQVHFPDTLQDLDGARRRIAFDEIFLLQMGVLRQKALWQSNTARVFSTPQDWLDGQITRLPFELTSAQKKAVVDIQNDLQSGRPMNRLLQGDVGSGKTIVAALAAIMISREGAQSAFMAPTSILADQHYRGLSRLLTEGENPPLKAENIRLLIGDTPENEKAEIRQALADGTIKIIVGTHALIEDPVEFDQLQLAVIDEQHRFGVAQRAALRQKGENPHLLVMTATPIPRSLALTVYGDLDLSVMDEMPRGRLPIETRVLHPLERDRAYQLIRKQVQGGFQAFVIYPLVEQNEESDENTAAVQEYERLQADIFPDMKLGLMHGRLKPEEKDAVMERFRAGEIQVMVSTSVVEVGVDVPNATVMLIESANRFGLSQLHQFRGRVGRGEAQSYCLLIPDSDTALENERLAVMEETNDGFLLAEKDLQQRGPGDFLGTRQSGYADLRMAKLTDVRLIESARHYAQDLFTSDPEMTKPENQKLAGALKDFWSDGKGDLS